MKSESERTFPFDVNKNALPSKSNSEPSVERVSQPKPITNLVKPGADLLKLTLPPFDKDTDILSLL